MKQIRAELESIASAHYYAEKPSGSLEDFIRGFLSCYKYLTEPRNISEFMKYGAPCKEGSEFNLFYDDGSCFVAIWKDNALYEQNDVWAYDNGSSDYRPRPLKFSDYSGWLPKFNILEEDEENNGDHCDEGVK